MWKHTDTEHRAWVWIRMSVSPSVPQCSHLEDRHDNGAHLTVRIKWGNVWKLPRTLTSPQKPSMWSFPRLSCCFGKFGSGVAERQNNWLRINALLWWRLDTYPSRQTAANVSVIKHSSLPADPSGYIFLFVEMMKRKLILLQTLCRFCFALLS